MTKQQRVNQIAGTLVPVLILIAWLVFSSIQIIQPGEVGIVIRMGEAQENALQEGMHFVMPFITKVRPLDVKIQKAEVRTEAASKDLQTVNTAIVINYRVDKTRAVTLFREIGVRYLETVIEPTIQEAFKSGAAKYTAEELITERSVVSQEIKETISSRLQPSGVIVEAFNITSFDFSAEFNRSIEEKMTAEQMAKKASKDLERFKFEAQQKVETAKGEAEAVMARAKAEAEALNMKKQYATPELIWLTAVEKWDGRLPTHLFGTPPTPVLDVDAKKTPETNTTSR